MCIKENYSHRSVLPQSVSSQPGGQVDFGNRAGHTDVEILDMVLSSALQLKLSDHQLRKASSKV